MTEPGSAATPEAPSAQLQYPPLTLWKLSLLLAITLTLYTFFWLYRAARDLRDHAGCELRPWLWALAPLLGPLMAIPCWRMSGMLNDWARRERVRSVTVNTPWLVAALVAVSNTLTGLPDLFGLSQWLIVAGIAGGIAAIVFMQAQLNAIKEKEPAASFHTPPLRYTKQQVNAMAVCGALFGAVGLILLAYFSVESTPPAGEEIAAGTVFEDAGEGYRLEVPTDGWRQVETGRNSDESELEFQTDRPDDWGILFVDSNLDMDEQTEDRVEWIRSKFPRAKCTERRSLADGGSAVIGTLDCTGASVAHGHYLYRSRVVADEKKAHEVFIFITARNGEELEQRRSMLQLADGLSLL